MSESPTRLTSYKNKDKTAEQRRRNRQEYGVSLRKEKRAQQQMKKRQIRDTADEDQLDLDLDIMQELQTAKHQIFSDNAEHMLQGTTFIRKLLSREDDPPIQEVVEMGFVPRLAEFLKADTFQQLQFEAAWSLTNIASGTSEQTQVVAQNHTIPHFARLLQSPNPEIMEQCVWAIGNIAGDDFAYRDELIRLGTFPVLLRIIESNDKLTLIRNATWSISNLCRGKEQPPDFEVVRTCLPVISRLLYHSDDEVLTDACWALTYLTDGPNYKIEAVVQAGVCRRLVELLMHSKYTVIAPALRAAGNIVTGTDVQTQVMLGCGLLGQIINLMQVAKETIRKEACWAVSNICAGTQDQIQAVIDANIFTLVVNLLRTGEFRTRKEALWTIVNSTSGGSPTQVNQIVACGVIPALVDMLDVEDPRLLMMTLEALECILLVGHGLQAETNPYADMFENAGGIDKLEACQAHENENIYEKAFYLVDKFFPEDDIEIGPDTDGQNYQFGSNPPAPNNFNF